MIWVENKMYDGMQARYLKKITWIAEFITLTLLHDRLAEVVQRGRLMFIVASRWQRPIKQILSIPGDKQRDYDSPGRAGRRSRFLFPQLVLEKNEDIKDSCSSFIPLERTCWVWQCRQLELFRHSYHGRRKSLFFLRKEAAVSLLKKTALSERYTY